MSAASRRWGYKVGDLVRQPDGSVFRRQYPFGPYVFDFYCAKIKLVIEIDGWGHRALFDLMESDRRPNSLFYRSSLSKKCQRSEKHFLGKRFNMGRTPQRDEVRDAFLKQHGFEIRDGQAR